MTIDCLKRWRTRSPRKLTLCSGAFLLALAGCGGGNHTADTTTKDTGGTALTQSEFMASATVSELDNWLDDPSLPTPPAAPAAPAPDIAAVPNTGTASEHPNLTLSGAPSKIVGGRQATESYPYMAALLVNGSQNCGGTLIAPTWVVTAAHCVTSGLTVRVGSLDRTSGGQVISVAQTIVHPNFRSSNIQQGNDIALLRLSSAVTGITPIAIASASPVAGTNVRLLGWGQTSPVAGADRGTNILKELDTRVTASYNCPSWATGDLCIVGTRSATACYGDSGGPALVRSNGVWQLAGATSRGGSLTSTTCGDGNEVYTNVTYFRNWINQYVGTSGGGEEVPPPPPGGDTPPCTNCTPFTGSLQQGQSQVQPNGSYFYSTAGRQQGWLVGPAGTDFDLALFYYSGGIWRKVAESASSGSYEVVSYYGQSGYYYWAVASRYGSGTYTVYLQKP